MNNKNFRKGFGLKKSFFFFISMMLALVLSACSNGPSEAKAGIEMKALYINVGKADSILVQIVGKNYLIDTGKKSSAPKLLSALNLMGVQKLDGIFLTHSHSDHIGGMQELSKHYDIPFFYSSEFSLNKKSGKNKLEELAKDLDIEQKKLRASDKIEIIEGIYFEVLGPLALNSDDDNDNSLILRLTLNEQSLLFTGDMQFAEEKSLMDNSVDLKSTILKVGNHGNPDATSNEFANASSPDIAIISTDTKVDTDSANERVKEALSMADIFITEDYHSGVLLNIDVDGKVTISDPSPK